MELFNENRGCILPGIALASGGVAACAVLYRGVRPYFPVNVNCWFCNANSRVPYYNRNNFECPSCKQYNGFLENGDYNTYIPAQYCESLNLPPNWSTPKRVPSSSSLAGDNGLCQTCNFKQTLKVKALADFSPLIPENYDQEVEEFRKRLDQLYGLCRQCEATLHQTLGKQDSWLKPKLIAWRLHQSMAQKMHNVRVAADELSHRPVVLHIFQTLIVLVSLLLLVAHVHKLELDMLTGSLEHGLDFSLYLSETYSLASLVTLLGLFLQLCSMFASGKRHRLVSMLWKMQERRHVFCNSLATFLWVGALVLSASRELLHESMYIPIQAFLYFILSALTIWVALTYQSVVSPSLSKCNPEKSYRSSMSDDSLNHSHGTQNDSFGDYSPPLVQKQFSNGGPAEVTSACTSNYSHQRTNLNSSLGSLKISSPRKDSVEASPRSVSFIARDLFSDKPLNSFERSSQQLPLLRPSRLASKNITQASWVAGGYWGSPSKKPPGVSYETSSRLQNSFPAFSLSRSSSQSSGFVSHSSGHAFPEFQHTYPKSGLGSHVDPEHQSVFSEPPNRNMKFEFSSYCPSTRLGHSQAGDERSVYSVFSEPPLSPSVSLGYPNFDQLNTSTSQLYQPSLALNRSTEIPSQDRRSYSILLYIIISFLLGASLATNLFFFLSQPKVKILELFRD